MDVGELFAQARLAGDLSALRLQPLAEGCHKRRGTGLAGRQTLTGRDTADVGLDGVELGDAAQPLGSDVGAIAVEDLFQLAPCMRPAMRDTNGGPALARRLGKPVVAWVAIDLQDTIEAGQESSAFSPARPGA
jgi:hypothetical protein